MIQARNAWVMAFDNLSYLAPWSSDALCRLATGGGFSTRELYSNDDETIFDAKRPVMLNQIEDSVTRADLLGRSLLIRHPPIDRVSGELRELPRVALGRLPRMADFALFAVACETAAGERLRPRKR